MLTHRVRTLGAVGLAVVMLAAVPSCTQQAGKVGTEQAQADKAGIVQEEAVTLDQVPDPVRATILREVGDSPLCGIDRKVKAGKTVYQVQWMAESSVMAATVAESGKVLAREK